MDRKKINKSPQGFVPYGKDECDGCGNITEVEKCGRFLYCKSCKEEVEKGN